MSYRTTRLNELELLNSSQKDTVDNRPLSSIFINLQYHRRLFLSTSSMIYAHFSFNSPFSPIPAQQSLRFSLMPDKNRNTTESKTPKGSSQINQKRSAKVKHFEGQVCTLLAASCITPIYNLFSCCPTSSPIGTQQLPGPSFSSY